MNEIGTKIRPQIGSISDSNAAMVFAGGINYDLSILNAYWNESRNNMFRMLWDYGLLDVMNRLVVSYK